jgi:ferredoxin-NADP reductase
MPMQQSIDWQISTIKAIKPETYRVKTLTLVLPNWIRHQPGQHYDIRLTAEDGYEAQRSYSIGSEPEREREIDLTVEKIEGGEVSPYLHDVLVPGDRLEMRGPIGGYFVWEDENNEPLMLVAGGSGIVPLMAMIRHRAARELRIETRLLYSSRTFEDIIYQKELEQLNSKMDGLSVFHTLTRDQPEGWKGFQRRIDKEMLSEIIQPLGNRVQVFVCGPTSLVESVANSLVDLGIEPKRIRTERFGPSGQNKGA